MQDGNGVLKIKSYDMLIYLLRSKDDRWYKNGTQASVIIRDIAKAWNIPLGQMDLPAVVLTAQPFRNQTLASMMTSVIDQVRSRGRASILSAPATAKCMSSKPDKTSRFINSTQML